jgi:hypothetical protein
MLWMLEWWSPPSTTSPFMGVLVGEDEAVERQGASANLGRASANHPLHCLAIQRWQVAPGWRLHAPIEVASVKKAVWRSVWPLQVYDGGPSDPRQLNLHLWIKPTKINAREAMWSVTEPPKLYGPHAPVIVPKTSDSDACTPDNLRRSVGCPHRTPIQLRLTTHTRINKGVTTTL